MIYLPLTPAEAEFLEGELRYWARVVAGSDAARGQMILARRIEELRARAAATATDVEPHPSQ